MYATLVPIALASLGLAQGALAQIPDSRFQELPLKRHLPATFLGVDHGLEVLDDSRAVALGDLDGDGAPDLVVGNFQSPTRWYRNLGGGRFADDFPAPAPGAGRTLAVALADVDRDGDLDLVLGCDGQDRLLLGDGTGGFTEVTASQMPSDLQETRAVLLGDVDRDGDPDLILGRGGRAGNQNRLYLNDGSGRFTDATRSRLPVDADFTSSLALGDLDRDGDLDLVLGNGSRDAPREQNRIYLNDGTGGFTDATAALMPPVQVQTQALALGDVDRDGDLDLVTGNFGQSRLYLNDGTGRLIDGTTLRMPPVAAITNAVAFEDLDDDGDQDLVLGSSGQDLIYLNDGFGVFSPSPASLPPDTGITQALASMDLDGDGDRDIVLGVRGSNRLFLNDGTGSFADATPQRLPRDPGETRAVLLADLDGDEDLDLILGNEGQPLGAQQNRLYVNDGTGRFSDATSLLPPDQDNTQDVVAADLDGDGDLDLVLANGGQVFAPSRQNRLYINDGHGRFLDLTATRLPPDADCSSAVAAGDVDGDGDLDLVLGNEGELFAGQANRLYLNDGSGRFLDASSGFSGDADVTRAVALGDVDGDGDLDLAVGNRGENRLYVNDGSGWFSRNPMALPANEDTTNDLALGDVDSDGDLDMLVGNYGQNRLYTNDGSGQFTDVTVANLPSLGDLTAEVAFADMNRDGDLDLVVGNSFILPDDSSIQMYLNDGNGTYRQTAESRIDGIHAQDDLGIATGDVDGDGDLDLVTGTFTTSGVSTARLFTNLQVQIATPFLPILSRNFELEFHTRSSDPATAHLVLTVVSGSLAHSAFTFAPYGTFYLDLLNLITLPQLSIPPGAGVGTLRVRVPNDPSLVGRTVYSQALILPVGTPGSDSHFTGYTADVIVR